MARPKPPSPLKPSAIRLTAEDWAKFRERGGVVWLRRVLQRPVRQRVARQQAIADCKAACASQLTMTMPATVEDVIRNRTVGDCLAAIDIIATGEHHGKD